MVESVDANFLQELMMFESDIDKVDMLKEKDMRFIASHGGGPILGIKKPRALITDVSVPLIKVFRGNGQWLKEFRVNAIAAGDSIKEIGWTLNYNVMIVTSSLNFYLYNLDGECLQKQIIDEKDADIRNIVFYDYGCSLFLSTSKIICIDILFLKNSIKIDRKEVGCLADCVCMWYNAADDSVKCLSFYGEKVTHINMRDGVCNNVKMYQNGKLYNEFTKIESCFVNANGTMVILCQSDKGDEKTVKFNTFLYYSRELKLNMVGNKTTYNRNELYAHGCFYFMGLDSFFYQKSPNAFDITKYFLKTQESTHVFKRYDEIYFVGEDKTTVRVIYKKGNKFYVLVYSIIPTQMQDLLVGCPLEEIQSECARKDDVNSAFHSRYCAFEMLKIYEHEVSVLALPALYKDITADNDKRQQVQVKPLYSGIDILASCAVMLSPLDPLQDKLLKCISYFLGFISSKEVLETKQAVYLSACHACRTLKTFASHGILMAYYQYLILARTERGKNKFGRHTDHEALFCTEVNHHPIQALMISMDEFSLCIKWCEELKLSKYPVLARWCSRKIQFVAFTDNLEEGCRQDLELIKQRMQLLSNDYLVKVLSEAVRSPSVDVLLFLSNINNVCRSYIVKSLLHDERYSNGPIINAIFLESVFFCDQRTIFYFFKKNFENKACVVSEKKEELATICGFINKSFSDVQLTNGTLRDRFPEEFREKIDEMAQIDGARLLWRYLTSWELFAMKNPMSEMFCRTNIISLENFFFRNFENVNLPLKYSIDKTDGEWFYYYNNQKGNEIVIKTAQQNALIAEKLKSADYETKVQEQQKNANGRREARKPKLMKSVFGMICDIVQNKNYNPEDVALIKKETGCSDKMILRAHLSVISEMSEGNPEARERLSKFVDLKKALLPWSYFVKVAHDMKLKSERDIFLNKIESVEEKVKLLAEINDFNYAIELAEKSKPLMEFLERVNPLRDEQITNKIQTILEKFRTSVAQPEPSE